jgi:hypothetical protein
LRPRAYGYVECNSDAETHPSTLGKELITVAVLGLILLAAAGVLTAAVVTSNTDSLAVDLWGVSVSNVTLGVVFVAGMITTVVAVVGLGLLMGGLRRNRRLRKERRSLLRENEQLAQRVDSTPDVAPVPVDRREPRRVEPPVTERPVADRPLAERPMDDRTRVQPTMPPAYDPAVDDTTTTRRRSFLPRREERSQAETAGSREV